MNNGIKNGIIILCLSYLFPLFIHAEEKTSTWVPKPDEFIELRFQVKDVGRTEITAIIHEKRVYLPVTACFKFLLINVAYDSVGNTVKGYYLSPNVRYIIDGFNSTATINKKKIQLAQNDFYASRDEFYLAVEQFEPIFSLKFIYNEKLLQAELTPPSTLPIFTVIQRDRLRRSSKGSEDPKYFSTTLEEKFPMFGVGMLDWDFIAQQHRFGVPNYRYKLKSGSQFLGGDLVLLGNGLIGKHIKTVTTRTTRTVGGRTEVITRAERELVSYPLTIKNIRGTLTYARLEYPYLKQIILGDIFPVGVLTQNIFGAEITNRPPARRIYFTDDVFEQELTSPQTIDMYSGNKFLSTQSINQAGKYSTNVPLHYGTNNVEMRSYDQWGAETIYGDRSYIPSTLLRPDEFRYSLSGGKLRFLNEKWYFNSTVGFGLNRHVTVGGTVEAFELPATPKKVFPALSATARLTHELVFDAFFSPNATSRSSLNLVLPSSANASLTLAHYARNYFFNNADTRTEVGISGSAPIFLPQNSAFIISGTAQQFDGYQGNRDRSAVIDMSLLVKNVQPRFGANALWSNRHASSDSLELFNLNGGVRIRFPLDVLFGADLRYDYLKKRISAIDLQATRYIYQWFVAALSFDRTYGGTWGVELRLDYVLPFAHLQGRVRKIDGDYSYQERANGSIAFSSETKKFNYDYVPYHVGYGDVILNPYVDSNNNGAFDAGEEQVAYKRVRGFTEGGSAGLNNPVPGYYEIKRTNAYDNYRIYLEPEGLDNPIWVPRFSSFAIKSFPNMIQRVDVPIVEGGIVRGKVVEQDTGKVDLEGITVIIESQDAVSLKDKRNPVVSKTMQTFSTGEFEFFPMPPGNYIVKLDRDQIERLGFRANRFEYPIEVKVVSGGDVIEGLNFELKR
jgi:hypothetical protein